MFHKKVQLNRIRFKSVLAVSYTKDLGDIFWKIIPCKKKNIRWKKNIITKPIGRSLEKKKDLKWVKLTKIGVQQSIMHHYLYCLYLLIAKNLNDNFELIYIFRSNILICDFSMTPFYDLKLIWTDYIWT